MPGAGKSSAGRALSRVLGYRFVDLDVETERAAGKSIAELFGDGESVFRAAERGALEAVAARRRVVVAAGGGALADVDALALARSAGAVVYLRVPATELARRLAGAADRPLLLDGAGAPLRPVALRRRLRSLLLSREPVYRQANLVVDAHGRPMSDVAREIAEGLRRLS